MNLKLIEPLRELFKDEVRVIGKDLDIPDEILQRHPFPGPGLAVRILGDITPEKVELLQKADRIFIEELHNFNLYNEVWQAFAVLVADSIGRRDGRFSHLRTRGRASRRDFDRRHDGRLGATAARFPASGLVAHHFRGARHQSRRLRHLLEAAEHD